MSQYWKCYTTPFQYPFYIVKHNLGIIPIHDKYDLLNRAKREGHILHDEYVYSKHEFSLYMPSGPKMMKASALSQLPVGLLEIDGTIQSLPEPPQKND